MRLVIASLIGFALWQSSSSAQPAWITPEGPKSPFACGNPQAKGPLTGLYVQENGGYVCVLDYGRIIELSIPAVDHWRKFSGRWERFGVTGAFLPGQAFLSGWGWRERQTAVGKIGEAMSCAFEAPMKLSWLADDYLLWVKPIVSYDTACCNLGDIRNTEEHLTRVCEE